MSITITEHCDAQEFLQTVRLDGLLKFNMEKTKGKLRIPDKEISYVARNESGAIIGGISGSTYLSSLEIEVLWVRADSRGNSFIFSKKTTFIVRPLGIFLSPTTAPLPEAPAL